MEYHEAVDSLHGLRRRRPEMGTETTASLLADLGAPHEELTAVQIAGSNGKGSTASVLDRILREAGLTVGLYTSPDLNDLRERIRVDGAKMPKREVCSFVDQAWPHVVSRSVEGGEPTFFEAITAMALWHFGREDVDVAVLEVGIGGRYDATSVVSPVAAAITSVSLEHTDVLGSTVEEIARDKAQVAPSGRPLVTGTDEAALETIREVTDVITVGGTSEVADKPTTDGSPTAVVRAIESGMVSTTEAELSLEGPGWTVETKTPLLGSHQALNAGIAATLARQVTEATERDIALGIRNASWPGRFEILRHRPLVVLDGAHNPAACERLSALLERYEYDDLRLVFGAMRDKDHSAMVRSLPVPERVVLAEPGVPRAEDATILAATFERETDCETAISPSVLDGLEGALRRSGASDCVLVTGSLYAVAEARTRFTRRPTVVRTDSRARARSALLRGDVPAPVRARTADRFTHRTVRLDLRRTAARTVIAELNHRGGYGALSGIETASRHVGVVLGGTIAQFRNLVAALEELGGDHAIIARQLAAAVDLDHPDPSRESSTDIDVTPATVDVTPTTVDVPATYPWAERPAIMATLDPRTGRGRESPGQSAGALGAEMVSAGADVIEVGSVRDSPEDAIPVDEVVPVVESLVDREVLVSVGTRRPTVAEAALEAGADMVTDRTGLADAALRSLVATWDVPVVARHAVESGALDRWAESAESIGDVAETLGERVLLAERAGIDRSRLLLEPELDRGIGGPDLLEELQALGVPVVVDSAGASTPKTEDPDEEELARVLAGTVLAVERGATVVRTGASPERIGAIETAIRSVAGDTEVRTLHNNPSD